MSLWIKSAQTMEQYSAVKFVEHTLQGDSSYFRVLK